MWYIKIDKIKEGNREKHMKNVEARSLEAVHTHTHTHTQVYLYKKKKQEYVKKSKIDWTKLIKK